jgi:polysaccharide biosynthesis/export protein
LGSALPNRLGQNVAGGTKTNMLERLHWAALAPRNHVIAVLLLALLCALSPSYVAAQASADQLRPYTINAGDEIEVYVWGEERLQRVIRILPDGTFAFPLVGKVDAVGKLPSDIEAIVTKGLESQYRGQVPQVTVSVRNPSGLQFSVAGKVKSPGTFSPGRYVNVLEALSFAGGPDEFASLDNVTIIRKSGNRLTSLKAKLGQFFKVSSGARDPSAAAIPQIESGDTVIVP